jgi:nucleotide-binding universal stress UspA family protein
MQMAETGNAETVVVGIDGSPESVEAARFAAEEAAARGLELLVVHACTPLSHQSPENVADAEASGRAAGQRLVDEVLSHIHVASTTVVDTVVEVAPVSPLLAALAVDAALLVLGQHQPDLVAGRLTGQVSAAVAGNVACPVVVVPDGWTQTSAGTAHLRPRPVVVSVRGEGPSTSVLRVAYDEARLRRAPLLIFHASTGAASPAEERAVTERNVAEIVAGQHHDDPVVAVEYRFVPDANFVAWVEASSSARLMVLGRPQSSHERRAWQYSLARAMLQRARCPLVVVPPSPELAHEVAPDQLGTPALVS